MTRLRPAELLLQELGITEPEEIDLDAIAYHVGARVRYCCLEGCEAHIIGSHDRALITVDRKSPRRRRRFSVAHELGHWHHHRGRQLVCRVEGFQPQGPTTPEQVANGYAADLLMPNYLFAAAARQFPKLDYKTVAALADRFDASRTAVAIRLVEAGHAPALLVCHGKAGRKWFVRGPQVPARWFPRADLDADSLAFDKLFAGKPDDILPRKIGADAWFDSREAERYVLREQTIRVSEDEILTLILLDDENMLEDR